MRTKTQHIRICGMLLKLLHITNNKPKTSRRREIIKISGEINEVGTSNYRRKKSNKNWFFEINATRTKKRRHNYQCQEREKCQTSTQMDDSLGMELWWGLQAQHGPPRAARPLCFHCGCRAVGFWGHCGPGEDEGSDKWKYHRASVLFQF